MRAIPRHLLAYSIVCPSQANPTVFSRAASALRNCGRMILTFRNPTFRITDTRRRKLVLPHFIVQPAPAVERNPHFARLTNPLPRPDNAACDPLTQTHELMHTMLKFMSSSCGWQTDAPVGIRHALLASPPSNQLSPTTMRRPLRPKRSLVGQTQNDENRAPASDHIFRQSSRQIFAETLSQPRANGSSANGSDYRSNSTR